MPKSFDRVADIYDDTRRMQPEAVTEIMNNISSEIDPAGGLVLDMGIGTGRIAVPLAERGFRIVGVDISEKMLARLLEKPTYKRHKMAALRGDATFLPFADNSFQAVVVVHLFHLLEDIGVGVKEAFRVLTPGGRLFFGGDQRWLEFVERALREKYGVEETFAELFDEAGIKYKDQSHVEKQVSENVCGLGGDLKKLPPVEWDANISCEELVGRFENRQFSSMWDVSDDAINAFGEKLRRILREHVGPLSTMIPIKRGFDMFCVRFD